MATKKTAPKHLTVTQFTEIVAAYPDDYIFCRDGGHHWRPVTANRDKKTGQIRRVLSCNHCGADRNQTLDRSGFIVATSYSYKQGYLIPKAGRLTSAHRAALRLASVTRIQPAEAPTQ